MIAIPNHGQRRPRHRLLHRLLDGRHPGRPVHPQPADERGSHERIAVVELFGRYSGETSLITAYLAGVDRAVIPRCSFDVDRLAELLLGDKRRTRPGTR